MLYFPSMFQCHFKIVCSVATIKLTLRGSPFLIGRVFQVQALSLGSRVTMLFDRGQGLLSHCLAIHKA